MKQVALLGQGLDAIAKELIVTSVSERSTDHGLTTDRLGRRASTQRRSAWTTHVGPADGSVSENRFRKQGQDRNGLGSFPLIYHNFKFSGHGIVSNGTTCRLIVLRLIFSLPYRFPLIHTAVFVHGHACFAAHRNSGQNLLFSATH
jgi:hypothetical protein